MRIPRRRLLALAAMVGAAMTLLFPTAASAAYYGSETDIGSYISSLPDNDYHHECTGMEGVFVCFRFHGDVFYVKDTKVDGKAAVVDWFDAEGPRSGACVNKSGGGDWVVCNKNFTEGHEIFFRAALYDAGNPAGKGAWISQYA